jgi:hypothetical protein
MIPDAIVAVPSDITPPLIEAIPSVIVVAVMVVPIIFPITENVFVAVVNVRFVEPSKIPLLLNCICVFAPPGVPEDASTYAFVATSDGFIGVYTPVILPGRPCITISDTSYNFPLERDAKPSVILDPDTVVPTTLFADTLFAEILAEASIFVTSKSPFSDNVLVLTSKVKSDDPVKVPPGSLLN